MTAGCGFHAYVEAPEDAARDAPAWDAAIDAAPIDASVDAAQSANAVRVNIKGVAYSGIDHPGMWAADLGVCPGAGKLSVTDPINDTDDDVLFQSQARGATVHCTIGGLANGMYEVTLLFAEIDHAAACRVASRVFSIDLEGATVDSAFDLVSEGSGCALAGDSGHPVARVYAIAVTDGALDVELTATTGQTAVLAALQVRAI